MSAIQCRNFVQNAWRKDLCANCFKPREEHVEARPRTWARTKEAPQGILKGAHPRKAKPTAVRFPAEESQVIGFGGDECFSSGEEEAEVEAEEDPGSDDGCDDGGEPCEEERALLRLTRSNTDFNTVAANLLGAEPRRAFTQLLLGRPLTDADGRRKTLLVSVTPFGDDPAAEMRENSPKMERSAETDVKKEEVVTKFSMKENGVADNKASRIPLIKGRLNVEKSKTVVRSSAFNGKRDFGKGESTPSEIPASVPDQEKEVVTGEGSETESASRTTTSKTSVETPVPEENGTSSVERDVTTHEYENVMNPAPTNTAASKIPEDRAEKIESSVSEIVETCNLKVNTGNRDDSKAIVKDFALKEIAHKSNGDTSKPALKFSGSYKKISGEERVIQNDACNTVATLSVRKLDGEPAGPVKPVVADGEYKAIKVMIENPVAEVPKGDAGESEFRIEDSREMAGEPDGRADPDEPSEPPELPRSPPPAMDPRPSFLHSIVQAARKPPGDKPKIPTKPIKILPVSPKKTVITETNNIETAELLNEDYQQQDGLLNEPLRTPQKRQAPKPPSTSLDEVSIPIFTRNVTVNMVKSSSPVAREKEKRERASSCSPKMRADSVSQSPAGPENPSGTDTNSRRTISLSVESLSMTPTITPEVLESEKKKSGGRGRFSLRKFLRLGHSKDGDKSNGSATTRSEEVLSAAAIKPRLEIIHPFDLNGAAVEVVRADGKPHGEDSSSTSSVSSENKDAEISAEDSSNSSSPNHSTSGRPSKPPPPPRNHSLDAWGRGIEGISKPVRPPPPKSAELLRQQKLPTGQVVQPSPADNLYANLGHVSGEVRSGLTPNKPQRTASIRDAIADTPKRMTTSTAQSEDSGYESVELTSGKTTLRTNQDTRENVYECVGRGSSSSPECDAVPATGKTANYSISQRRSDGCLDSTTDYSKFRATFVRSASLPYCGSETESDIYYPYSFYGSEEGGAGGEEEPDWLNTSGHPCRTSRLRLRKGRSIVHKSLEDNYGAVIVANHEALAQVLEQVNHNPVIPPALRGLKATENLRWSDFTIMEDSRKMVAGHRVFYPAIWCGQNVTLCVTMSQGLQSTPSSRSSSLLTPITEFSDLVPAMYLPMGPKENQELLQASIAVLFRLHVETVKTYGYTLRDKNHINIEDQSKDANFVLLQIVNGLKALQAQGIEEAPLSLSNFVLCREERDPHPRLTMLQELGSTGTDMEKRGSLCQCALMGLKELLPASSPLASLLSDILSRERAVSLSQAKSVLEFSLWGPADVALGAPQPDRELALQRWLDLERATVLHGLVKARVDLNAFEECQLLFLVRTSSKIMTEASFLLDTASSNESTDI